MDYPFSSPNDTIWKGLFLERTIFIILKDSDFELEKINIWVWVRIYTARGKWFIIIDESFQCWVIQLTIYFRGSVAGINCLYTKQTENSFKSTNYRFYLAKISKDATNGLVHPNAIRMVFEMITAIWFANSNIPTGSHSMILSTNDWFCRINRGSTDLKVCQSMDLWMQWLLKTFWKRLIRCFGKIFERLWWQETI